MSQRLTGHTYHLKRQPALILVPNGTMIIDGKVKRLLRIEREKEYDDHIKNPHFYGLAPPPPRRGRPPKNK